MPIHAPDEVIASMGPYGSMLDSAAHASGTWPTANQACYQWLYLLRPRTIQRLWVANGSAVSGNFDIGLYDHTGRRLVHTGSTAQAGISTTQTVAVTPLTVGPGSFLIALVFDNTTAQVFAIKNGNNAIFMAGAQYQNTAFPLPNPATLASIPQNFSPFCGISCRGF